MAKKAKVKEVNLESILARLETLEQQNKEYQVLLKQKEQEITALKKASSDNPLEIAEANLKTIIANTNRAIDGNILNAIKRDGRNSYLVSLVCKKDDNSEFITVKAFTTNSNGVRVFGVSQFSRNEIKELFGQLM